MKNLIKKTIYLIISLIEKIEYKHSYLDNKKILNTILLDNILVETDYGYVPASEINITVPYSIYTIKLENGLSIECADDHIFFDDEHILYYASDLKIGKKLMTKYGASEIIDIKMSRTKVSMFDLSIETDEHSYFTNDILSHNTISTSIFMLHTAMFNNEKNIMIVADRGDTVKEILKKMKDIYLQLPYFMKTGMLNWSESKLAFDNSSVVHTQRRSKNPAIGFSIDVLYIDEFAKIPDTIARSYYGTVIPTVSSMKNSKVIITSTPDGYNLFWELLIGAEKDTWDPLWNGYRALRVFWYQVKGRRDTKIQFDERRMSKFKFKINPIVNFLKKEYGYSMYEVEENDDLFHFIKYDKDDESTKIENIRRIRYNGVALIEFCKITNWEEEQTKLIGGANMFKQEYDLQFLADDKLLFDSATIESIKENTIEFEPIQSPLFAKLGISDSNLKIIKDKKLFDLELSKKYKIIVSIDLGAGLGNDYSTINIFRLMERDKEDIEKNKESFVKIYDFFKLEQIGIWRSNIYSVEEVAHVLYLICYDLFHPENVKVVLEMNGGFGDLMLSKLPHVFNDKNDYSSSIFFRYKHKESDTLFKIGLKIARGESSSAKNAIIKDYQMAVRKGALIMHEEMTIRELATFTKKETSSGNVVYKAESGHDDAIMTLINVSSVYNLPSYKDMIDNYIQYELDKEIKQMIYNFTETSDNVTNLDGFGNSYKKVYKTNVDNNSTPIPSLRRPTMPGVKTLDNWWGSKL